MKAVGRKQLCAIVARRRFASTSSRGTTPPGRACYWRAVGKRKRCGSCRPKSTGSPAQRAVCRGNSSLARTSAPVAASAWLPRLTQGRLCQIDAENGVSFAIQPIDTPERPFVKRSGQAKQAFANQIKEKPKRQH